MAEQAPSVGRMVHYVSYGTPIRADGTQAYSSQCRAAVITEVWYSDARLTQPSGTVGLCVLNPSGVFFHDSIDYCDDEDSRLPGTWHWPERV